MESLKKMVVRQFNELLGFTTEERNKLFVESLTSSINTKDSYLIAFLIMIFSFKWDQEVLGLLINHKATHQAFREDGFLFPFLSLFAESFCPKKGITIKAVPLGIVMSKMEFAWTETQSLRTLASRVIELVVVMMSWELALHPVTEFNSGLSKETHIPPELFMAGSQLENRERFVCFCVFPSFPSTNALLSDRRLGKAMSDEMINYYYFYSTRHKEASKVPQANHFNGDLDLNTLPQQIDNIDLANLVDKRFMPPCILGIFNKHQADQLHAKHDERFALLYYYLPLVNR
jgi:hypothetical protein